MSAVVQAFTAAFFGVAGVFTFATFALLVSPPGSRAETLFMSNRVVIPCAVVIGLAAFVAVLVAA